MPSITALLHTHNDALRLGRCLETLYPCDDILIIDGGSTDGTLAVAREYGARVLMESHSAEDVRNVVRSVSAGVAHPAWMLCLDPRESLSEALAASLYEWKSQRTEAPAFSVFMREETPSGWTTCASAQTRLVPPTWAHWNAKLPSHNASALALEGELLRFSLP